MRVRLHWSLGEDNLFTLELQKRRFVNAGTKVKSVCLYWSFGEDGLSTLKRKNYGFLIANQNFQL